MNNQSHISIKTINFYKAKCITLITFQSHCSHKLQLLDVSVYGSLKHYYNVATDQLVWNPDKTLTIYEIPKLVSIAVPQAFKPQNIQNGFSKTDIWSFNSEIFSDENFLSSVVTDRRIQFRKEINQWANSDEKSNIQNKIITKTTSEDLFIKTLSRKSMTVITPENLYIPKSFRKKKKYWKKRTGRTKMLTNLLERRIIEQEVE